MEVGYSLEQVSGPKVDREKYPSINQSRNVGGSVQGFVADILNDRGKVILTTTTQPTPEALMLKLEQTLADFNK